MEFDVVWVEPSKTGTVLTIELLIDEHKTKVTYQKDKDEWRLVSYLSTRSLVEVMKIDYFLRKPEGMNEILSHPKVRLHTLFA